MAGTSPALLRRKTNETQTDKTLVVEGGWVQKRFYYIGWPDKKRSVEAVTKKKARRSRDNITVRRGKEVRNEIPEDLEKWYKRPGPQRKIGSGKEESRRTLRVKVNGRRTV